jgi:hypothetical protein
LKNTHAIHYLLILASSVILLPTIISTNLVAYGQQSPTENEGQSSGETPTILTAVSVGPRNSFEAKITWTPADIGQPNKFHVEIFDANQLEPRSPLSIRYDIKIYQGDKYLSPAEPTGNEAVQNEDFSHDYTFVFLQEGSYVLAIEEIQHEGENIRIPIQVTPEFPLGIVLVITGLLASIIAITRISFLRSKVIK